MSPSSDQVSRGRYDAVIVGAGPNGLAAAIALAQEGLSTLVVEALDTPGGGARSDELTLPGFLHDVCSTVHPLGIGSPFFRTLPLEQYGLSWLHAPSPLAHVLDEDTTILLERSLDATARQFGEDGAAYRRLLAPFVERFDQLMEMILGPLRFPSSPLLLARFGLQGLRSFESVARARFEHRAAPALLAGAAAHAMLPLSALGTTSFALVLAAAGHAVGWPVAKGGSRAITSALVAHLRALGGEIVTGLRVERAEQLPEARAYLLDVGPGQLLRLAGDKLPARYERRLRRYRYGPGSFKMDFALSAPIPWRDPRCAQASTVHLAGDLAEISANEAKPYTGEIGERPFVLLVQASLFDQTRAPPGMHTAWAYCHVPNGSALDAAPAMEAQIERFAPGFRDIVLARAVKNARDLEAYNPNYVGGDINAGLADIQQLLVRPVPRVDPYSTPIPNLFLCSSATPPGGGVHGMCGYWAARSALRHVFGRASARPEAAE